MANCMARRGRAGAVPAGVLLAGLVAFAACLPAAAQGGRKEDEESRQGAASKREDSKAGAHGQRGREGSDQGRRETRDRRRARPGRERRGRRKPEQEKWSAVGERVAGMAGSWRRLGSAGLFDGGAARRVPQDGVRASRRSAGARQPPEPRSRWADLKRPRRSAAPPEPRKPAGDSRASEGLRRALDIAERNGVPRGIAKRLFNKETDGFQADAVSEKDATGVAQVLPATGQEVLREMTGKDYSLAEVRQMLKDPETGAEVGMRYLAKQYRRFGDWTKALAAYNAGPDAVRTGAWRDFDETRDYVRKINGG